MAITRGNGVQHLDPFGHYFRADAVAGQNGDLRVHVLSFAKTLYHYVFCTLRRCIVRPAPKHAIVAGMNEDPPKSKRPYFRPTTPDQRRLLFETYERTGDVNAACSAAHMARRTFYLWLPRFRAGGYAALMQTGSKAPHKTRIPPTPAGTVAEVIAYKQAHPEAGYRRIANELKQAHHWQAVISATQVRRILLRAGLVGGPAAAPPAARPAVAVVHAPEPDETLNIDLCVVPLAHQQGEALQPMTLNAAAKEAFSPSAPPAGD